MPDKAVDSTLRSRYVEQAVSDLKENRRLQQELIDRIARLKQEETLLLDILAITRRFDAPNETAPSVPEQTPAEAATGAEAEEPAAVQETVPQQTREVSSPAPAPAPAPTAEPEPESAEQAEQAEHAEHAEPAPEPTTAERPTDPGKAPSKKAPRRTTTRSAKARAAKANPKATPEPRQPLPRLGDLFTELLGAHGEPRLAKELREELLVKHPDRAPTPQVVRNTLESLVAKGRVQRHKQQRSVLYTVAAPDERDAPQASG